MNNENYKLSADLHRRHVEFQEGDYVMIRITLERYLQGIAKKLQACSAGPTKF